MFKLAIAVTAVLVAMSVSSANAAYSGAKSYDSKPDVVKASSGSSSKYSGGKSAYGKKTKASNKVASARGKGRPPRSK